MRRRPARRHDPDQRRALDSRPVALLAEAVGELRRAVAGYAKAHGIYSGTIHRHLNRCGELLAAAGGAPGVPPTPGEPDRRTATPPVRAADRADRAGRAAA
jgi:hypothetical protein